MAHEINPNDARSDSPTVGCPDNKESLQICKDYMAGSEVVKTEMSFKKGLIVGVLILAVAILIGVLIGYGIGVNVANQHYTQALADLKSKCIML